jgi:hypothetical protein
VSWFSFNGFIYLEDDMSGCGGFGGDKCGWAWETGCKTKGCPSNMENDMSEDLNRRSLSVIAAEIGRDWCPIKISAVPYLRAMRTLDKITDNYGADSAESIVLYFLCNAGGWRGEVARRVKTELREMVK